MDWHVNEQVEPVPGLGEVDHFFKQVLHLLHVRERGVEAVGSGNLVGLIWGVGHANNHTEQPGGNVVGVDYLIIEGDPVLLGFDLQMSGWFGQTVKFAKYVMETQGFGSCKLIVLWSSPEGVDESLMVPLTGHWMDESCETDTVLTVHGMLDVSQVISARSCDESCFDGVDGNKGQNLVENGSVVMRRNLHRRKIVLIN